MSRGKAYHILMADVVDSRSKPGRVLGKQLNSIVTSANSSPGVLSPFVVTLGDEFQGVVDSLASACQLILKFEGECIRRKVKFRLRYSLHKGLIETPINHERAHGMLGPGLTRARELLNNKSPGRLPVLVDIGILDLDHVLQNLFMVSMAIKDRWKNRDYGIIYEMLTNDSDQDVASKFGKDRSQIWKRRNTLLIKEYIAVSEVIQWTSTVGHG